MKNGWTRVRIGLRQSSAEFRLASHWVSFSIGSCLFVESAANIHKQSPIHCAHVLWSRFFPCGRHTPCAERARRLRSISNAAGRRFQVGDGARHSMSFVGAIFCDPFRVGGRIGRPIPGGVAALSHRLISGTPSGVWKSLLVARNSFRAWRPV